MKRNGLPSFSAVGALAHRWRASRTSCWRPSPGAACLRLLVELGDDDVPAAHRHDHEDAERGLGDEVAALPQRFEAVGVVDDLGLLAGRGAVRRARRRRRLRRRRPVSWPMSQASPWAPLAAAPRAAGASTASAAAISSAGAMPAHRVGFQRFMLSPGVIVQMRESGPVPRAMPQGGKGMDRRPPGGLAGGGLPFPGAGGES